MVITHVAIQIVRLSKHTTDIWKKIDPYYQCQRHKCSPRTLLSSGIRLVLIFAVVPWRAGLKRQRGAPKLQCFSNFGRHIFKTFRAKAKITISDTKYLIGLPMTLKCLTLNDREMPFVLKSIFCVGMADFFCLAFKDNYVKVNKDTAIGQRKNVAQGL